MNSNSKSSQRPSSGNLFIHKFHTQYETFAFINCPLSAASGPPVPTSAHWPVTARTTYLELPYLSRFKVKFSNRPCTVTFSGDNPARILMRRRNF